MATQAGLIAAIDALQAFMGTRPEGNKNVNKFNEIWRTGWEAKPSHKYLNLCHLFCVSRWR
jgi:hypothetical protein